MIFIDDNNKAAAMTSVALGLFDGVHLAHRYVITKALSYEKTGLTPAVFTFDVNSIRQKHNMNFSYIYTNEKKFSILESMGIKFICSPDFDKVRNMSGDEFARKIIKELLNAKEVICGYDFSFGTGGKWTAQDLAEFGKKYGFTTDIINPVLYHNGELSSSVIRQHIKNGRMETAADMLGNLYSIYGEVMHGREIGRTISFPTVNQLFYDGQVCPKYGVYASSVNLNGKEYCAITNVGVKPTVGAEKIPLSETHILNFDGNLYGETLDVKLWHFIRDEHKFAALSELKNAIEADIFTTKRCFLENHNF